MIMMREANYMPVNIEQYASDCIMVGFLSKAGWVYLIYSYFFLPLMFTTLLQYGKYIGQHFNVLHICHIYKMYNQQI